MKRRVVLMLALVAGLAVVGGSKADRVSDIARTKHNLSATGPGTVKATGPENTEICVFCHTPHGASAAPGAPLWNRQLPDNQLYTVYESASLDAQTIAGQLLEQPLGSSKLCLSCHDGTLALGTVNVYAGSRNVTIGLGGTGAGGTMPPGGGAITGFTRNLGTDLRNDHPVSLTYNSALAAADRELFDPAIAAHIGLRTPGTRKPVPLEPTGQGAQAQIQCASCHDPHLHDPAASAPIKFLRLPRFQSVPPVPGAFNQTGDILCVGCHDKRGWATSAHASSVVADELYTSAGAALREFPARAQVWQAACLNCHDPHTVHGSRRLAREGTDGLGTPKSGGNSAIEETCYQCHSVTPVIGNTAGQVPDIKTEFGLARRMPITDADQQGIGEVHDIADADLTESQILLGKGNSTNRHAECTDCHNPHRTLRNSLFNNTGVATDRTHRHAAGVAHDNVASGALRGGSGVEPVYSGIPFLSLPLRYELKRGDGGDGASTLAFSSHLTREYQACLKCHSDYGYDDTGAYPLGGRPSPGDSGGTTPTGTNNLTQYTNQAMEFQAPLTHRGEVTSTDSGAGSGFSTNNHRSWHPVIDATGRSAATRQMSAAAFVVPWNAAIGTQSMYCSDCHGRSTAANTVVPPTGRPWGPHGSEHDFLLKGTWNALTGSPTRDAPGATDPNNGVCFKCHDFRTYADRNGDNNSSGFRGSRSNNLHALHADRIDRMRCSWCHTAVPHGWKNKGLLVNLNDVGREAGNATPVEVAVTSSGQTYNQGPYYLNAKLKVRTFATSGNWEESNCGSASGSGGTGQEWMRNVCVSPP
jgi:Doubled CXXCH motif (Paired_CXXCH_1)